VRHNKGATKVLAVSPIFDRKSKHVVFFAQQFTTTTTLYHRTSEDTIQDLTEMAFYEGPRFVLILRVIQAVLTILILGLTGYGKLLVVINLSEETS
jgi:hypothetical protein